MWARYKPPSPPSHSVKNPHYTPLNNLKVSSQHAAQHTAHHRAVRIHRGTNTTGDHSDTTDGRDRHAGNLHTRLFQPPQTTGPCTTTHSVRCVVEHSHVCLWRGNVLRRLQTCSRDLFDPPLAISRCGGALSSRCRLVVEVCDSHHTSPTVIWGVETHGHRGEQLSPPHVHAVAIYSQSRWQCCGSLNSTTS